MLQLPANRVSRLCNCRQPSVDPAWLGSLVARTRQVEKSLSQWWKCASTETCTATPLRAWPVRRRLCWPRVTTMAARRKQSLAKRFMSTSRAKFSRRRHLPRLRRRRRRRRRQGSSAFRTSTDRNAKQTPTARSFRTASAAPTLAIARRSRTRAIVPLCRLRATGWDDGTQHSCTHQQTRD